ncbi:MAG: threonine synthase, partial [Coriobacteriia bacterium]|nr:threonine synthase [Coriobacteriia bacterium]
VCEWMGRLAEEGRFQVDRDTFAAMRELFTGDWVSNDDALATVRRVFDETGYLMDPHTAVAWEVAERTVGEDPILVVSTAHWAKFAADVLRALTGTPAAEALPEEFAQMSGVELLGEVRRLAGDTCACIPEPLAELDGLEVRFDGIIDAGHTGVEDVVRAWLA